ncbi:hypothetical protein NCAS_0H03120 [Naumovozyma castellii]|uniref:Uncharacterized protein n=1 Tax=Naumovozyma castellii TaxID=27288 RepID=G0VJE3_NAUCA|nr:hypothetical protein NCAS_0H03120 [Naumovozyma castellii CBS 4309]CCC71622.1 hypothetical protein NCAS_0H03120 [Naumovozyma castellii CBS 4309]
MKQTAVRTFQRQIPRFGQASLFHKTMGTTNSATQRKELIAGTLSVLAITAGYGLYRQTGDRSEIKEIYKKERNT